MGLCSSSKNPENDVIVGKEKKEEEKEQVNQQSEGNNNVSNQNIDLNQVDVSVDREKNEEVLPIWIKTLDKRYDTYYFFNTRTGESRWEKPVDYIEPKAGTNAAIAVEKFIVNANKEENHKDSGDDDDDDEDNDENDEDQVNLKPPERRRSSVSELAKKFEQNQTPDKLEKRVVVTAGDFKKECEQNTSRKGSVHERVRKLSLVKNDEPPTKAKNILQQDGDISKELNTIVRQRKTSVEMRNYWEKKEEEIKNNDGPVQKDEERMKEMDDNLSRRKKSLDYVQHYETVQEINRITVNTKDF